MELCTVTIYWQASAGDSEQSLFMLSKDKPFYSCHDASFELWYNASILKNIFNTSFDARKVKQKSLARKINDKRYNLSPPFDLTPYLLTDLKVVLIFSSDSKKKQKMSDYSFDVSIK